MSRSGIVNVRMVITEEKILSNIDKIQKLINPKSKKQIVQLEEDTYFKDLIESVKTYLLEYPKKKNFPSSVYKSAYSLVEFATNQFEENTKRIEKLIRQREQNIALAGELKALINSVVQKTPDYKERLKAAESNFPGDIIDTVKVILKSKDDTSEDYENAMKLLKARVNNLESNLHIEIDMERIEDRSKALSYIGIEIADALRTIPTPVEEMEETTVATSVAEQVVESKPVANIVAPVEEVKPVTEVAPVQDVREAQRQQQLNELQATRIDVKPSLWERVKQSKIVRAIRYVMRIRVVIDVPNALPEGRGEDYNY